MKNKEREFTPSRTSPKNSRRACLCKHKDTYSKECCKGDITNQGIGTISRK